MTTPPGSAVIALLSADDAICQGRCKRSVLSLTDRSGCATIGMHGAGAGAWGLRPHYDLLPRSGATPRRGHSRSSSDHGRGSSGAAAAHHEKIAPKIDLEQPPIFSRGCAKSKRSLAQIFHLRSIGGEWRSLRPGCGRCGRSSQGSGAASPSERTVREYRLSDCR